MARTTGPSVSIDMTPSTMSSSQPFSDKAKLAIRQVVAKFAGETVAQRSMSVTQCHSIHGAHGVWQVALGDVTVIYKQLQTHHAQAFSHASTFSLQQRLFQQGVAAEPLWFDEDTGEWIEAYLPAPESTEPKNTNIPNTDLLIQALVNLHQVHVGEGEIRTLDPFAQAEVLLAQLSAKFVPHHPHHHSPELPADLSRIQLTLRDLQSQLHSLLQSLLQSKCHSTSPHSDETPVLCHNDLHVDHVRAQMCCVDWEYAGVGPRYFDVAMCLTINHYPAAAHASFIAKYVDLAGVNPEHASHQVSVYLRLCDILNELWSQVLQQNA